MVFDSLMGLLKEYYRWNFRDRGMRLLPIYENTRSNVRADHNRIGGGFTSNHSMSRARRTLNEAWFLSRKPYGLWHTI
jgi:hypothetical protein